MSNDNKVTRKLKAILSADVKGYSLLMADDEVHTIQTLKAYRQIMSDLIQQHSGRVVDNPGDNLLAEFSSAVDAVECSVHIQNRLNKENAKFVEVFVKASVDECARRDVKGLYEKAFSGEIPNFTGVSHPYEEPPNPEVVCDTEHETVEESTKIVLNHLEKEGIIPKA